MSRVKPERTPPADAFEWIDVTHKDDMCLTYIRGMPRSRTVIGGGEIVPLPEPTRQRCAYCDSTYSQRPVKCINCGAPILDD